MIPIWKELKGLPARVKILEDKLAELQLPQDNNQGKPCPFCGQNTLILDSIEPSPNAFSLLGQKVWKYHCSNCGEDYENEVPPGK